MHDDDSRDKGNASVALPHTPAASRPFPSHTLIIAFITCRAVTQLRPAFLSRFLHASLPVSSPPLRGAAAAAAVPIAGSQRSLPPPPARRFTRGSGNARRALPSRVEAASSTPPPAAPCGPTRPCGPTSQARLRCVCAR